MSEDARQCMDCEGPIDRTIPNPIPDDYELMWTESLTGQAHYCRKCFERADA